jgi:biopolymer transport protein ExbD
MDFSDPPRRRREENLLPMVNVVFLLLIFFLISAKMMPPEPFDVTPPEARAEAEARGEFVLFIGADGQTGYHDAQDAAALTAVAAARESYCQTVDCAVDPARLTLRADAALPASRLAALLPALSQLGFDQMELVARVGGTS